MSLKTTEFVTNNMIIVLHPPYSLDLAPCDFALFPKLKMKPKGRRFETVSDIERVVLDSIKENDFHSAFEVWKNDGIAVYIPKRTILKEMAAKIKSSRHLFFYLFQALSNIPRMANYLKKPVSFIPASW
jgi:hypothetical protein